MKTAELAIAAIILAVAVFLIFQFISAKGERKKVVLTTAQGSQVTLDVEIADNPATQMKGLMGRSSLGEGEGMLFVFDKPAKHSFWMLNTTIPLDAIHVSEFGEVVDVITMEPCGWNVTNCPTYAPKAPSKYVLEVNKGFAMSNSIVPGKSRLVLEQK